MLFAGTWLNPIRTDIWVQSWSVQTRELSPLLWEPPPSMPSGVREWGPSPPPGQWPQIPQAQRHIHCKVGSRNPEARLSLHRKHMLCIWRGGVEGPCHCLDTATFKEARNIKIFFYLLLTKFVVQLLIHVRLFETLWTETRQVPHPSLSPKGCSNSCPLSQ